MKLIKFVFSKEAIKQMKAITPNHNPISEKTIIRTQDIIAKSNYISRDLSWLSFDERVLDQARDTQKSG